jgi:ATP-dependent DNA helicase RecQ
MIAYADTSQCLRGTILRYFGDPSVGDRCGSCGNCQPQGSIDVYERELVRKILSGIARAGERYGRRRIVAMLVGHTSELPPDLTTLSTTGLLRHEPGATIEQWIDAGVAAGLIAISTDRYRTLSLTAHGRDVMSGRAENLPMSSPVRSRRLSARRRFRDGAGDAHRPTRVFEW